MVKTENFEKVEISAVEELRNWLMAHFQQEESVWLVTYMKNTPGKYVSRWDVLDELLCFGWTDGIRRKLDGTRTMQLISKRRAEHWAKSYKDRVTKLTAEGRMHESGLESVERAKESGMWNFMDDADNLVVPEDLKAGLASYEGAADFFHSINDSSKRFVLRWLKLAKTRKTRERRIEKLAFLAAKGEKLPGS